MLRSRPLIRTADDSLLRQPVKPLHNGRHPRAARTPPGTAQEKAPDKSAALLHAIWDTSADAMALYDEHGTIVDANPAYARVFGHPLEDVVGRAFTLALPPDCRKEAEAGHREAFRSGVLLPIYETEVLRADGAVRTVQSRSSFILAPGGKRLLFSTIRDVTESKEAEASLKKANADLRALFEMSSEVLATSDIGPLLQMMLDRLDTAIPYHAAAILTTQSGRLELQTYRTSRRMPDVSRGGWMPELLNRLNIQPGDPYIRYVPDIRGHSDASQQEGQAASGRLRTLLATPLTARGRPLGIMVVCHRKPDHYNKQQRDLLNTFANHAAIAMLNSQLQQQARHAAIMQERSRLSSDLHNSVAQALYSVNLYADAARMALSAGNAESALRHLAEIKSINREATADTRLLLFELMPPVLEERGLAEAIQARLRAVENRAGFASELVVEGEMRLPPPLESDIYRAAHEALTNVLKHAHASHVWVRLAFSEKVTRLSVLDDGTGFSSPEGQPPGSTGLNSIKERVGHLGGRVNIESAPGRGTRLTIEVPNA